VCWTSRPSGGAASGKTRSRSESVEVVDELDALGVAGTRPWTWARTRWRSTPSTRASTRPSSTRPAASCSARVRTRGPARRSTRSARRTRRTRPTAAASCSQEAPRPA
jgi:hypothetical protein